MRIEQTSKAGTVYHVLKYPPVVQREIVEHYIKDESGGAVNSNNDNDDEIIDPIQKKEKNNKYKEMTHLNC